MSKENEGINPAYTPYSQDYAFSAGRALLGAFAGLSVLQGSLVITYAHSALLLLVFLDLVDALK